MRLTFLIFAWGAVLAAAPFSHRLHVQMKLECVTCHSAALTSTKMEDNLLPAREVCARCHQGMAVPGPPTTRVAKFNHSLHLRMGNVAPLIAGVIDRGKYLQPAGDIRRHLTAGGNACTACHRGMVESEQVAKVNLPQMADCLVCHVKIENPYSCEQCHGKGADLRPPSHVAGWVDLHSNRARVPDKTTCAVCHGREFTCMGCH